MNREQAKQLLPIIQAFANGADVQFDTGRAWCDCSDPTFYTGAKWRIKPKLIEAWAVIDAEGSVRGGGAFNTVEAAGDFVKRSVECNSSFLPFRIVRLREVTE